MEFKQVLRARLPEVVEVNHQIFGGMYAWPSYPLEKYEERFRDSEPIIFTAEENGTILADCISYEKDGKWYLWMLGVKKEYRGHGIARRLLEMTETYAREHLYRKISAKVYNVSKEMLLLLVNRGYEVVGFQKHELSKYNAILLELNL